MTNSYERVAIKKTSYIQTHLVYANVCIQFGAAAGAVQNELKLEIVGLNL